MAEQQKNLTLAIQKGGRLGPLSVKLLQDGNFQFNLSERVDWTTVSDFPLEIFTVRNKDIPTMVQDGDALFGISHQIPIRETGADVIPLLDLKAARCSLVVGVAIDSPFQKLGDLAGFRVATSYPRLTDEAFGAISIEKKVREGSVELSIPKGWTEGIVDITSSGESMRVNGIRPIKTVVESANAQLIASPKLKEFGSERLVETFLREIVAVMRGRENILMKMNVSKAIANEVINTLPGLESPTMSSLADGNFAFETVVKQNDSRMLRERLLEMGVRGILEDPVKKVVPDKDDRDIMNMMGKIYH